MKSASLTPHPNPSRSYQEAVLRIKSLQSSDGSDIHPLSKTVFLDKGKISDWAVVWFHGYTSSPFQFRQLGSLCHELGANVLIPRVPFHGQMDAVTDETQSLTAQILQETIHECVDIAVGLGHKVIVGGLSMGGVMTTWAAQVRSEIHFALPISPALGFHFLPSSLTPIASLFFLAMPNINRWWDQNTRSANPERPHTHARISTHALFHIIRLGLSARRQARCKPPAARSICMVLNDNDRLVNNEFALGMVYLWKSLHPAVQTYQFDIQHNLPHDLIDPTNPNQKINLVYPVLIDLVQSKLAH